MIRVTNSCGDCGYASGAWRDFEAHHRRVWHRTVMQIGLRAALASNAARLPDANRAKHLRDKIGAPLALRLEGHGVQDGAVPGIRCPAVHEVAGWCSRDEGHPGAHESRQPHGRGLGAWWNERYGRDD